jgi:hypothetical protein
MALYPTAAFQTDQALPVQRNYGFKTWFYAAVLFATLLCGILYDAGILKLFNGALSDNVSRSFYLVTAFAILSSAVLVELSAAFSALLLIAYFMMLNVMGAKVSPNPVANSMVLNYCSLACAPIAAHFFRRGDYNLLKNILLLAGSIYALMYIYASLRYAGQAGEQATTMIAASDGRDARIFMNSAGVTLLMGVAAGSLKNRSGSFVVNAATLLIGMVALYLSQSRQVEAVVLGVLAAYFVFGHGRIMVTGYCLIFLTGIAVFGLLFVQDVSIYSLFGTDQSAIARQNEMIYAGSAFRDSPILGVGIYNPIPQILPAGEVFDKSKSVFWNDLGIYGIFYCAGLVGCLLFVIMALMTISSRLRYIRIGVPRFLADGLGLAGVMLAVTGFSSTSLWNNGCEIFAFVIAAYCCPPRRLLLTFEEELPKA